MSTSHFLVNFRATYAESQGENMLKYLLNPSDNKEITFIRILYCMRYKLNTNYAKGLQTVFGRKSLPVRLPVPLARQTGVSMQTGKNT
jgi:hypothetical protein